MPVDAEPPQVIIASEPCGARRLPSCFAELRWGATFAEGPE